MRFSLELVYFSLQTKGDRPLEEIIAEHTTKLQKKSLLFSGSNTQLSSLQKVCKLPENVLETDFEKQYGPC